MGRRFFSNGARGALGVVIGVLFGCAVARAQPADEFYKGKRITITVGTAAGGDYDIWAREIGRFMARYLPGNPVFVTQNMPGSGFIVATNYLYNIAPRDGTAIGMVSRNIPHSGAQELPGVRFDAGKFHWLGTPEGGNRVCFARSDSGVEKAEDLFTRELIVAGTGSGSGISATPALLKNLLGMKLKIVEGYRSVDDGALAMERGEVQGICETWTAFNQRRPAWIPSGGARALLGLEKSPVEGTTIPTVYDFLKTDEQRDVVAFYASSIELGRPMLAPPGVPPARVAQLRAAFDMALKDPEFIQHAKELGLRLSPRSGVEVEAMVKAILATPRDLVKKMESLTASR